MAAICITQHCGQKRDSLELYGDCASILSEWVRKQGPEIIGLIGGITGDGGQKAISDCAELCAKGIKAGSCCKGEAK